MIVSLASRILLLSWGYDIFSFTLCRLDNLAIGAMLALFVRGPDGFRRLDRLKPHLVLLVLVPVVFVFWYFLTGKEGTLATLVKYPLAVLLFGTLLATALNPMRPLLGRVFSVPFLRMFGKYSYGLYVWDVIVNGSPFSRWSSSGGLMRSLHLKQGVLLILVSMIVQFTLTWVVAFISWHAMENQVLKFKRFFEYEKRPAPAKRAEAKAVELAG
jgi:peptidoglycan/LPS O-acetylase OafA/YrhL